MDSENLIDSDEEVSKLDEKRASRLFLIWKILLLPWIVLAPLLGMVADSPASLSTYVGLWSVWSYPISVLTVWIFRKRYPRIVLFPCINFVVFLFSSRV